MRLWGYTAFDLFAGVSFEVQLIVRLSPVNYFIAMQLSPNKASGIYHHHYYVCLPFKKSPPNQSICLKPRRQY